MADELAGEPIIDLRPCAPAAKRSSAIDLGGVRWAGVAEYPPDRRRPLVLAGLAVVLGLLGAGLSTGAGDDALGKATARPAGWAFSAAGVAALAAAVAARCRRRPVAVTTYEHGLIYEDGGAAQPVRWADVTTVTEQIDILFNALGRETGRAHLLRLQTKDGGDHRFELGRTPDRDVLSEYVHQGTLEHLVPRAERVLAGGGAVPFGPISISAAGLSFADDTLTWEDLGSVEQTGGLLVVRTKTGEGWCEGPSREIPNLQVLITLIESRYVRRSGQSSASRVSLLEQYRLTDGAPRIVY